MSGPMAGVVVTSGFIARYDLPQKHLNDGPKSFLTGHQVVLVNPEDFSAGFSLKSTAVYVQAATQLPSGNLPGRRAIAVFNTGPSTLYIGNSAVTTSNGWPIPSGGSISLDLHGRLTLFGASNGTHARVLELG